jgi:hypothetical protein
VLFAAGETLPWLRYAAAAVGVALTAAGLVGESRVVASAFPASVSMEGRRSAARVVPVGVLVAALLWIGAVLAAERFGSAERIGVVQVSALGIGGAALVGSVVARYWYLRVLEVSLPVRGSRRATEPAGSGLAMIWDSILVSDGRPALASAELLSLAPDRVLRVHEAGVTVAGDGLVLVSSLEGATPSVVHLSRSCPWDCPRALVLLRPAVLSAAGQLAHLMVLTPEGGAVEETEAQGEHAKLVRAVERNLRDEGLVELAASDTTRGYETRIHPI